MKLLGLILIFMSLVSATVFANVPGSMFDRRVGNEYLFDVLQRQGLDRAALDLMFRMYDYNQGRILNTNSGVIVDYSLPSVTKRLFLLNLITGQIERFYVAHGINSGVIETRSFSNQLDSWKSSLGFYYAKGTYVSPKNGLSLRLAGIDASNNNAKARQIVMHGAKYVSDDFIAKNGRLGWSEGCFAVGEESVNYLINTLQAGSLLLSYHRDLQEYSRQSPEEQQVYGQEIIPPGTNTQRTLGEGGDDGT